MLVRESTEGESEHDFPYPHLLVQVVNKFPKVFYVHMSTVSEEKIEGLWTG